MPDFGCDCADTVATSDERDDAGWIRCQCNLCGVVGVGCKIKCSPIAICRVAIQKEDRALDMTDPILCGDCVDHFLLGKRQQAVKRAREKRKSKAEDQVKVVSKASESQRGNAGKDGV